MRTRARSKEAMDDTFYRIFLIQSHSAKEFRSFHVEAEKKEVVKSSPKRFNKASNFDRHHVQKAIRRFVVYTFEVAQR